ncbi:MAG: bacterioferritin [Acidimicrobiales bacterium]|nr:bacterioferritin [Acidimicrobiales bacterium]
MRGDPKVIELLNEVLSAELTAVNQYFGHAKLCQNWGYLRLAEFVKHESIDEMRHAELLIDRILYLEGMPNLQRMGSVRLGETVPEQFRLDLDIEYAALERLNRAIAVCVEVGDNGSRELFESILTSEEEHTDWLETQLETIGQIGEANYLTQQLFAAG